MFLLPNLSSDCYMISCSTENLRLLYIVEIGILQWVFSRIDSKQKLFYNIDLQETLAVDIITIDHLLRIILTCLISLVIHFIFEILQLKHKIHWKMVVNWVLHPQIELKFDIDIELTLIESNNFHLYRHINKHLSKNYLSYLLNFIQDYCIKCY